MLEIKDVNVHFSSAGAVGAVEDFSLTLEPRSKTVLIGESGSGKSVLLLSLLRLLPATAQITGSVLLDGVDLFRLRESELEKIRGDRISYIPQGGGNGLNPLLKIGLQVGEPLMEHRGYPKKKAVEASIQLLRRFRLGREEAWIKAYPHMLSGGMRQRAMIAMGVAAGSRVILADEPTKGLDSDRIQRVVECFRELREETLLCVTHDIHFAQAVGQQFVVMYAAQQLEIALNQEFFANPLHPYSQAILRAMPENGLECSVGFAPPHDVYASRGCRFSDRCPYKTPRCEEEVPPMLDRNGHKVRCWKYAD